MAQENTTVASPGIGYLKAKFEHFKKTFTLDKEFTTIGRIGKNDIRLPFGSVSRTHATIVRTPVGYKIVDNGSKHGVVVNNMRVIEKLLDEGDKLQIGDVHLLFTTKEPDVEMSAPIKSIEAPPPSPARDQKELEREIRVLRKQIDSLLDQANRLAFQMAELEKQIKSGSRELEA